MTDTTYQIIALAIYLAAMLFIGWYAYRKTANLSDYMLGGRGLGPAVAALSAGAYRHRRKKQGRKYKSSASSL